MSLIKKIFTGFSEEKQDAIMIRMMRSGRIMKMPVWQMLYRTVRFMGVKEFEKIFSRMKNENLNPVDASKSVAYEMLGKAIIFEKDKNKEEAANYFFKATLYFLVSDFLLYKREESFNNYKLAIPCYDKFIELSNLNIERINFPYKEGFIKSYYFKPEGKGPFPAIIFTQGNEGLKEFMTVFAKYAVDNGIAVLNGDPPGWGESGLSGIFFRSKNDMKEYAKISVDFLQSKDEIQKDNIGIFGVSYGGFTSCYCAGLEKRIKAAVGIGGPFTEIKETFKGALAAQRRKSYSITGAKSIEEHFKIMDDLDMENVYSNIEADCLIIHGAKDDVVPPDTGMKMIKYIKGNTDVRIIEGEDHMCSHSLDKIVNDIMKWFKSKLV